MKTGIIYMESLFAQGKAYHFLPASSLITPNALTKHLIIFIEHLPYTRPCAKHSVYVFSHDRHNPIK